MKAMLRDDQVAILYDIAQSIAFADDKEGEVQTLVVEGYLVETCTSLRRWA